MIRIILNDEQAKAAQLATETVELLDQRGHLVGYVSRPPQESTVAEARRRANSAGPWYTTQQVLEHLESLDQQ
jgi:hypothetical protein